MHWLQLTTDIEILIMLIRKLFISGILLSALNGVFIIAQTQSSATVEQANAFFQAQKWEESAKAYETITKTDPGNAKIWYRLGVSLYKLGQYENAVTAYERALEKMP